MKRFALSVLVASVAAISIIPTAYAVDFDSLRRENLEKSNAVDFDQLRWENLEKDAVDFNSLHHETI